MASVVSTGPDTKLLGASNDPTVPLIICFHGSGESCEPSWNELAGLLESKYRVLLYQRGSSNPAPASSTRQLLDFLHSNDLHGPYILIAHSYGGAFARMFLHEAPKSVVGAVLVETGQEGGLDVKIAAAQIRKTVLKDKPLSVIRGDSLIETKKALEEKERAAVTEQQKAALAAQRALVNLTDDEDEKMKKEQLKLSRNARYVHLPDCGHHVIRDRPDVVAGEVDWVVGGLVADQLAGWEKLAAKARCLFGLGE